MIVSSPLVLGLLHKQVLHISSPHHRKYHLGGHISSIAMYGQYSSILMSGITRI